MAKNERLRIYTPAGKPTRSFKPRGEVHRDGDWHGTVHLWVMNSSNELLFQQRSTSAELHPGLWDVSAAGHMVGEDSLIQTLKREAFEELGITISTAATKPLFTLKTELHTMGLHECVFQHIYLLHKDIADDELCLQTAEVAAIAWHHYSLLERLANDAAGFVPRGNEYAELYRIISQLQ